MRKHTNPPTAVSQAYYYYLAEPVKTMQQTVLDVLAYLNTLALPVRHLMYDSWWRVLASMIARGRLALALAAPP